MDVCVCAREIFLFLFWLGGVCDENGNRGGFTINAKGKAFRATFKVDRDTSTVSRFPASSRIKKSCKLCRFYQTTSPWALAPAPVGEVDKAECEERKSFFSNQWPPTGPRRFLDGSSNTSPLCRSSNCSSALAMVYWTVKSLSALSLISGLLLSLCLPSNNEETNDFVLCTLAFLAIGFYGQSECRKVDYKSKMN